MSNRFLLEAKNIIKTFPPTAALAAGMSFEAALIYGNVTGGLAVEKLGTAPAMPYKEEIMAALNK